MDSYFYYIPSQPYCYNHLPSPTPTLTVTSPALSLLPHQPPVITLIVTSLVPITVQ